jgi:hypothetical protein
MQVRLTVRHLQEGPIQRRKSHCFVDMRTWGHDELESRSGSARHKNCQEWVGVSAATAFLQLISHEDALVLGDLQLRDLLKDIIGCVATGFDKEDRMIACGQIGAIDTCQHGGLYVREPRLLTQVNHRQDQIR